MFIFKVGECSTSKENLETNSDEKLSAAKESVKDKPNDESRTSEIDNLQENNLQENKLDNKPSDRDENKIQKTLSTTNDCGKRKLIDTKDIGSGDDDSDDKINESKKLRTWNWMGKNEVCCCLSFYMAYGWVYSVSIYYAMCYNCALSFLCSYGRRYNAKMQKCKTKNWHNMNF